ncbi:uncharacterized protein LOC141908019 [Tubulanus polymorphus]|uniref:uncharacterized protein LOC141908019 n=1 Tax=Tubulanus polymorphus TaxID=672921 RepID=UPI003DA4FD34
MEPAAADASAARTRYFGDALKFAIEARDTEMVQELLLHRFSPEAIIPAADQWPQSPLLEAVSTSQLEVATVLLKHLGTVSSAKLLGKCLMCAVGLRSKPLVELLIQYGADINCSFDYASPLARACILGDIEIANFIHEKGGRMFGKDILPSLASRGYDRIVERLLNWGVFAQADVHSAMMEACSKGYTKVLDQLLSSGIKIDFKNMQIVLDTALKKGHMAIAKMVLSKVDEIRECLNSDKDNVESEFEFLKLNVANDGNHNHQSAVANINGFSLDIDLLFHLAVITGNCDMVRNLSARGANVNNLRFGNSPLYTAVLSQMFTVIPILLELGADINGKNTQNRTALHAAARIGLSEDIMSLLLENGADPLAKDNNGRLPLSEACELGTCKPNVVKILLDAAPSALTEVDKNYSTALHIAAARGRGIMAVYLIESGAGVEYVDCDKNTPLHLACRSGCSDIVDSILTNKFVSKRIEDLTNAVNKDGKTALHYACAGGFAAIIGKLLSHGADPNKVDHKCCTSLHYAVVREEAVAILIESGLCDVECEDTNGCTALHKACAQDPEKPAVISALVNAGANVNTLNAQQTSPLMMCCSQTSSTRVPVESIRILLTSGAEVNSRNPITGETPLLMLCKFAPPSLMRFNKTNLNKQTRAVAELLDNGARGDDKTADTMSTALDLACHSACNVELVKFLLAKLPSHLTDDWLLRSSTQNLLIRSLQKPIRFRKFTLVNTVELLKTMTSYGAEINLNDKCILDLYEWNLYVTSLVICLANQNFPTFLVNMAVSKRDLLTVLRLHECGYDITESVMDRCKLAQDADTGSSDNNVEVFVNDFKFHVNQVVSLKGACRLRLRHILRMNRRQGILGSIRELPLPRKLQEFLAFMSLPELVE